jgi:hypothetical protein
MNRVGAHFLFRHRFTKVAYVSERGEALPEVMQTNESAEGPIYARATCAVSGISTTNAVQLS